MVVIWPPSGQKLILHDLRNLTLPVYKAQIYRVHQQIINVSIVLKYFIEKLCLGKNCLKGSLERQYLGGGEGGKVKNS